MSNRTPVGKVLHFFTKISVAVIELSGTLKVGDRIEVEGPNTKLAQNVESMQIEHKPIQSAGKGQSVGMKLSGLAHEGDAVFKVGD